MATSRRSKTALLTKEVIEQADTCLRNLPEKKANFLQKDAMKTNLSPFHDEATLADTAVKLGQQALQLGLIPSFVVRYFLDSRQFYIPDEQQSEPLTPEQAYLQLKRLLERSNLKQR